MYGTALLLLMISLPPVRAQTEPAPSAQSTRPAAPQATSIQDCVTLLTGQNTPEARRIGARGLLAADPSESIGVVRDILSRPDEAAAQLAICQELANITDPPPAELIEPVLKLLDSSRTEIGEAAARCLPQFDRKEIVPRLQGVASNHASRQGQRAAIAALGRMGETPEAVGVLVGLLTEADADTVAVILTALEHATGVRHATVADAQAWWKANHAKPLDSWLLERDARRQRAVETLETRVEDLQRRLVAQMQADYLRRPENDKHDALMSFLADAEPAVRLFGLERTNALITDRKSVPDPIAERVRALLTDPEPDVRRAAAAILGDIRSPHDAALLADALKRETLPRVQGVIIRSLGRVGDVSLLPMLADLLDADSRDCAGEAVAAIGLICERHRDADPAADQIADRLLARLATLNASDNGLLTLFLDAMGRINHGRFLPAIGRFMDAGHSPDVRAAAIRAAAATNDAALADAVAAMLKDETVSVRIAAAASLARCGRTDAHLSALLAIVEGPAELDSALRAKAWESFGAVLRARPPAEQFAWIERLSPDAGPSATARRIDLLAPLERALANGEAAQNAELRARVQERLADAYVENGQFSLAAALYEQLVSASSQPAESLVTRLAEARRRTSPATVPATATAPATEPAATGE